MAGVGFAMRRLADHGGLFGPMAAFGYATMLAAGPYLGSSLAIVVIGAAAAPGDARIGLAIAAYATAFSMVVFGPLQFASARVLGDLLHAGRQNAFSSALVQLSSPQLAIMAIIASTFLVFLPMDVVSKMAALTLFLALGGTWLAMVPLSAARRYQWISVVFMAGMSLGCMLALMLGKQFGLPGLLSGLALGQSFIWLGLVQQVDREFGSPDAPLQDMKERVQGHWALMATGAAYAGGLWIDKLIFWFHPASPSMVIAGPLRVCPPYDNGMSLAALSTIPALALFVLLAETDLASRVRDYFATLEARASLQTVEEARSSLKGAIYQNLKLLALIQGVITLGVVIFSPEIVNQLHLPWLSIFIFRVGAVGAFFQVLFMTALVHLLYLDLPRQALGLAGLFCIANAIFTWMSAFGGLPAYGFGFAAAGALAFVVALFVLDEALNDLEFHVFMRQPI
jgi:uncharacterized membrane protein